MFDISLSLLLCAKTNVTEPIENFQVELGKRLVASSFANRVFFTNSGTEANEAAIKFARKFQRSLHPSE